MLQTISITPKWQIHIPVKFRKLLGIVKPGIAEIELLKDAIVIRPKPSPVLKLAGKYRHRKPVKKINIERIRDRIDYSNL